MFGTQFYSRAQDQTHPNYHLLIHSPPLGNRKQSPALYYKTIYQTIPPLQDNSNPIKHTHTTLTGLRLAKKPPNNILNASPLPQNTQNRADPTQTKAHYHGPASLWILFHPVRLQTQNKQSPICYLHKMQYPARQHQAPSPGVSITTNLSLKHKL